MNLMHNVSKYRKFRDENPLAYGTHKLYWYLTVIQNVELYNDSFRNMIENVKLKIRAFTFLRGTLCIAIGISCTLILNYFTHVTNENTDVGFSAN